MRLSGQLIYGALYQIGWLVCVCLGNTAALAYALSFVIFHLGYVRFFQGSSNLSRELYWLILISLAGYGIETIFFSSGLLYENTSPGLFSQFNPAPCWLFALWLCFAIALRSCLSFIFIYPRISYCLFAFAVPLTYLAGTYLNSNVHIHQPQNMSLIFITLGWMLMIAFIHFLKRRYFEDIFYVG
jgi:hypothetical protein